MAQDSPAQCRKAVTAIPERPLLAPWYRLVEDGERLLLEHGQAVVVLEGAAVRAFLPALLPLLDGTRTCEELVRTLGIPAWPAVDLALGTLASEGLLVEGPDVPAGMQAAAHAIGSLFDLSPAVAAERIASAAIGVAGSSAVGVEVGRLLRASGVAHISHDGWKVSTRLDLAVVAPAADELEELDPWNRAANDSGACWLPVLPYDGRFAAIGPLVIPGESCCYECLVRRREANLEHGEHFREIEQAPLAARADPAFEAVVASLAAHLALRWIGGRDGSLPGVLHAVEVRPALSLGEHHVLRVPRCPVCSPVERRAAPLPWHEAHPGGEMAA
jgi:bacteriocin biosynthesis cyclodehydratase domain-containing protein